MRSSWSAGRSQPAGLPQWLLPCGRRLQPRGDLRQQEHPQRLWTEPGGSDGSPSGRFCAPLWPSSMTMLLSPLTVCWCRLFWVVSPRKTWLGERDGSWRQLQESSVESQNKGGLPISRRCILFVDQLLHQSLLQANYKPLRLAGTARRIYPSDESSFSGPVFIGIASPVGPDLTSNPQTGVFTTKHFADMRFATDTPWWASLAVQSRTLTMRAQDERSSQISCKRSPWIVFLQSHSLIGSSWCRGSLSKL